MSFDGAFGSQTSSLVSQFQNFSALPVTGKGDYQTWCSLLVSTGDTSRVGGAVDCVTTITPARAQTLYNAGYRVVGRYLTNVPNTSLDKKIKPGEIADIFAGSCQIFPIYQTWGGEVSYFSEQQGARDASLSVQAAAGYGFDRDTIIYHAVDFDALNSDITSNVSRTSARSSGPWTSCTTRTASESMVPGTCVAVWADVGLTESSFVADLSTGFSGNLGFPLPRDWAFDQISTVTIWLR